MPSRNDFYASDEEAALDGAVTVSACQIRAAAAISVRGGVKDLSAWPHDDRCEGGSADDP